MINKKASVNEGAVYFTKNVHSFVVPVGFYIACVYVCVDTCELSYCFS